MRSFYVDDFKGEAKQINITVICCCYGMTIPDSECDDIIDNYYIHDNKIFCDCCIKIKTCNICKKKIYGDIFCGCGFNECVDGDCYYCNKCFDYHTDKKNIICELCNSSNYNNNVNKIDNVIICNKCWSRCIKCSKILIKNPQTCIKYFRNNSYCELCYDKIC
jgi:hypothetical protein